MSFDRQKGQELVEKAENGNWSLECDEKLLELMQNVASKIETRSANIKSNISKLDVMIDGTKVKLSNLTRINSIKNTNYCENLIQDDTDLSPDEEQLPKEPVKLSPQIAIENGLKLIEHCFEKHRVNLDPSSSQSQTSIVYRPIDKYKNVLPHLIGSKEWEKKWHVGLLDSEKASSHGTEQNVEEAEELAEPSTSNHHSRESSMLAGSSLMASQDSLAKSTSSIGDQMAINRAGELFDEDEHSIFDPPTTSAANPPLFFHPQPEQRKIVNLFDDEPPSLNPSPGSARKPVNLFDDYGSTDSLPFEEPEKVLPKQPQPPVDLFNDNEFDDYIKKMESNENASKEEAKQPPPNAQEAEHNIRKKLSEEIMKVQLKKVDPSKANAPMKKAEPVKLNQKSEVPAQPPVKKIDSAEKVKTIPMPSQPPQKVEPKSNTVEEKPRIKKITNLFDDEDDENDYFTDILKQKEVSKPKESQAKAAKPKLTNLFDDEEDNSAFDDIFKAKPSTSVPFAKKSEPEKVKKTSLFDDDDDVLSFAPTASKKPETVTKKTASLFADDDDSDLFVKKFEPPVVKEKPAKTAEPDKHLIAPKTKPVLKVMSENKEDNKSSEASSCEIAGVNSNKPLDETDTRNIEVKPKNVEYEKKSPSEIQSKESDEELSKPVESLDPTPEDELLPTYTGTDTTIESDFDQTTESIPQLNDYLPQHSSMPNFTQDAVNEQNLSDSFDAKDSSRISETPTASISTTLPFLDDEPPPDDDEEWETEENYEDHEPMFKPQSTSYPVVPVFDDLPPEDDFIPSKPNVPAFNWSEDESEAPPVVEILKIQPEKAKLPAEKPKQDEKPQVEVEKPKVESLLGKSLFEVPKVTNKPSVDEIDRSAAPGSIKSKLDLFKKKSEEVAIPKASSASKPTPGKLSSNLKINVGALMPGARLSKESVDRPERMDEPDDIQRDVNSAPAVVPSSIDPNNNSSLLNNQLAKSRAKIQVKRRPSTRRGRQENYRKSLHVQDKNEDSDDDMSTPERSTTSSLIAQHISSTKNLSMSMFDDGDDDGDDEDFLPSSKSIKKALAPIQAATPPPAEPMPKAVTTNKIAVFYDDEDDTRMMVEQRKLEEEKKKSERKISAAKLFDDEIAQPKEAIAAPVKQSVTKSEPATKVTSSVFYESDDDDLFGSKKSRPTNTIPKVEPAKASNVNKKSSQVEATTSKATKTVAAKPKASNSLFDDAEDDDLFESLNKKTAKAPAKKASKLFESDDENEVTAPAVKPLKSAKSLFGDDSDDDDLFSSKPKASSVKPPASTSKSSTIIKKQSTKAVNDPLKDLFSD